MTSSDPTRDPGSEVDAGLESSETATTGTGADSTTPSTDLVPHDDGGAVADPRENDQRGDDAVGGRTRAERPAVNRQTRIGAAWVAVAVGVIVLVLLLIFILQNLKSVTVTYFSAHGTLPLGVLLLFAAAGGALLVIVLGVARMMQMRLLARRDRKAIR